jgi:phosphate starvation-inducible membrane PsiE
MDLLEALFEFLMSWRLFVGLGVTAIICWLLVEYLPNDALGWALAIPIGIIGVILSFWWEIRNGI